jgi:hypothetical protein
MDRGPANGHHVKTDDSLMEFCKSFYWTLLINRKGLATAALEVEGPRTGMEYSMSRQPPPSSRQKLRPCRLEVTYDPRETNC